MIIHKNLIKFLEIIYKKDLELTYILESELRKCFKNNEYYNLLKFCIEYELIINEYHKITLTTKGYNLFKILKI